MRYAHIVLGLPVDRPFDYEIPDTFRHTAAPGCRVWVNFRGQKTVGYIVRTAGRTAFPSIKPLLSVIDELPLLSASMLSLTSRLSRYYCCSWGEMIETALPERLRNGAQISSTQLALPDTSDSETDVTVFQSPHADQRWEHYCVRIRSTLAAGKRVIILLPDTGTLGHYRDRINRALPDAAVGVLFRKQPDELNQWQKIRSGEYAVILGTRSAVFAPAPALGLIIVDDEHDHGYKQDQVPHYHARVAAFERCRAEGAAVVYGSGSPSLELALMSKQGKAKLIIDEPSGRPHIKTIDTTRLPFGYKSGVYVSKYVQDSIAAAIPSGKKTLVFINRKGFATIAACSSCGAGLKCPHCSTNLVYYFRNQSLACSFCSFRMSLPKICPMCNSGYIKFLGSGTEKVESELARLFPSARLTIVSREHPLDLSGSDIFVSTQSVLSQSESRFDLTVVLSLDNSLNHVDFRASEKSFALLSGLASITTGQMVIQTGVPRHYVIESIERGDPGLFYHQELSLRKQLLFPPYRHFALIKCRGKSDEKTRDAAAALFEAAGSPSRKGLIAISLNPGQPARLRENYYWQVLVSGANAEKMSAAIKNFLKDFRRSGIIVTVDVDPL